MAQCSARDQWEQSHSQILIQTRFMSAWASRQFAAIPRMAMESTNPPMPVRHGNAWDWKTLDKSLAFVFIQKTRTSFTLPRRVMCGGRMKLAAFIGRRTAARHGKEFFTKATKLVLAI